MEPYQPRYDYTVTLLREEPVYVGHTVNGMRVYLVEIWDLKLHRLVTKHEMTEWSMKNIESAAKWYCWEFERKAVREWIARNAAAIAKEQQTERVKRRNARRSAQKAKKGQVLASRMARNNRRKAKAAK